MNTQPDRKPMANITPFGLRMQPDLKARVEEAARANNRSLNAEIVFRLTASLAAPATDVKKRCADIAAAAAAYYVSKIDDPADVGYWHGASASAAAIATEIEKG